MAKPLSIITTGRNDNYDGNFNERLIFALNRNIKALPEAEFIFVEWNPIPDKPLVGEAIRRVFRDKVKCYVVHPKYHERYCSIYPFIEYPPKNAGVRRSQGDFVACINSDIIFAPDLVANLKKPLQNNTVYRGTRVDIKFDYLRVTFPLKPEYKIEEFRGYNACGDFLCMDRMSWMKYHGYCEAFPRQRLHKDSFFVYILTEIRGMPVVHLGSMTHWRHPSSWSNGYCRNDVGDVNWNFRNCGFMLNDEDWGLAKAQEINRNGIIWLE